MEAFSILKVAAASEFLELDGAKRLEPGGVAIHDHAIVPVAAMHVTCALR